MKIQKGYYKGVKVNSAEYWDKQYEKYLEIRENIEEKGYHLAKQKSKERFIVDYLKRKDKGESNIIVKIASKDKSISFKTAQKIYEEEYGEKLYAFDLKRGSEEARRFREITRLQIPLEEETRIKSEYQAKYNKDWNPKGDAEAHLYFAFMAERGMLNEALEDYGY